MFETQKVRRHDKFRKEWSQHKNKCKNQIGQDQVSRGVRVLCWLAAPVAIFYGNLQNLIIRSKLVIKSSSVKFANWCNVWSIESVIVYGHVPECHVTFGRGRLHNFWWDPHIDHKTSWGTISIYKVLNVCPFDYTTVAGP